MNPWQVLRLILFSRPWQRVLILLTSAISTTFGLIGPFLQKEYLDLLLGHPGHFLTRENYSWPIWTLMIFAFICIFAYLGLSQLTNYLGSREAIHMQSVLSRIFYNKALLLRADSLEGRQTGEMVAVYATDIPGATILLEQTLPIGASIIFPLIVAPIALVFLFDVPWLPLLFAVSVVAVFNFIMAYRQSVFFFQFKKLAADRIGVVNEWVQNIRTLRILGWIPSFETKIFGMRIKETANRVAMVTNGQAMNSVASSITFVLNILVVWMLLQASQVSPGQLMALLWIVGVFLTRPFRQMPWLFTFIFDSWTSVKRFSEFHQITNLAKRPISNEFKKITDFSETGVALQVRNLNLKIGEQEILKSIDLQIKHGEFVAIVGEVGAGKSLLLLSLMGETGASFEEYSLGANDALNLPPSQLRQFFTFVPQESFIMSASLRENIAFQYNTGKDLDERILSSLQKAQFEIQRERITDGLNTEIGERGVNLSGGQKQRVSLARVDFHSSPIVLIDDGLSAVDVETENLLIESLLKGSWKNKTRLLVTHRLTVLDEVDRIIFLEDGRIKAEGQFDELLRKSPSFQKFAATVATSNETSSPTSEESGRPPLSANQPTSMESMPLIDVNSGGDHE